MTNDEQIVQTGSVQPRLTCWYAWYADSIMLYRGIQSFDVPKSSLDLPKSIASEIERVMMGRGIVPMMWRIREDLQRSVAREVEEKKR